MSKVSKPINSSRKGKQIVSQSVPRNRFPGYPRSEKVTLRYVDNTTQTATGLSVFQYRLNGPYDPDEAVGGNQPLGFDQYMALYNRYRVEKCHVVVDFVNGGTTLLAAIAPSISVTDPSTIEDLMCLPRALHALIPAQGGMDRHRFIMDVDIKEFFGLAANIDNDLTGDATSAPSKQLYLHVGSEENDSSAKAVVISVFLEFEIKFMEFKQLALS